LFNDFLEISLKAAPVHNGNKFPSVTQVHAGDMKESYENMKLLLKRSRMKNINGKFVGI
jgi:hypothetical protein